MGFSGVSNSKESTCNAEGPGLIHGWGRSPGVGNGRGVGNGSRSVLAWRIPQIEEPGVLCCMGLQRVGQTDIMN